jgi:hypothetical protein
MNQRHQDERARIRAATRPHWDADSSTPKVVPLRPDKN